MKIINEFKDFAVKGNMIDMSIGIIIGGAFTQIVNSLVKDIVMPPLGVLTGNVDFSKKSLVLKEATEATAEISMNYGQFLNALLNFLIVAITIFIVIKYINKLKNDFLKKLADEEKTTVSAGVDGESKVEVKKDLNIEILSEIRDLLKNSGKV